MTLNHEWTRMDTNAGRSCFPARDLPSATDCLLIAAAGSGVCGLLVSREDAKGNAGVTLNHEWARMNVARAFQPEICPLPLAACGLPLRGGGGRAVGPTRRREDAKETQG